MHVQRIFMLSGFVCHAFEHVHSTLQRNFNFLVNCIRRLESKRFKNDKEIDNIRS